MSRWGRQIMHRQGHHVHYELESTPDITRGQVRLVAEVMDALIHGQDVPTYAHEKAARLIPVMARG